MRQIIHNNKYDTSILNRIHNNKKKRRNKSTKNEMGQVYVCGKRNKVHHKTLQEYQHKVAYTTSNNIGKLPAMRTQKTNKYDGNRVYQLECPTCNKKYIGQTE